METLLYVESLTVSFDGFRALDNLNLILERGERIRILIGPNGAGKTTLFDVLTGSVAPTGGRLLFRDTVNLLGLTEHTIANLGISRKFQTPSIFPGHSVFENMVLAAGAKRFRSTVATRSRSIDRERLRAALEQVGLLGHAAVPAGTLSHGQKQWLEIAMLLVEDPTLLLLDEPVAGMTRPEREKTAALLDAIVDQTACSIVLIEHDMEFVRQIARRGHKVTVLHEGAVLSEGALERVQADPRVVEAYLGRSRVTVAT
jgi:urea transport system ATP-binding protein